MSLVRIYREMRDDPVPKIFTDGGDPGGMSGSLRRRKKRRSVGHRSRTGSRASAPLPSRWRRSGGRAPPPAPARGRAGELRPQLRHAAGRVSSSPGSGAWPGGRARLGGEQAHPGKERP